MNQKQQKKNLKKDFIQENMKKNNLKDYYQNNVFVMDKLEYLMIMTLNVLQEIVIFTIML